MMFDIDEDKWVVVEDRDVDKVIASAHKSVDHDQLRMPPAVGWSLYGKKVLARFRREDLT